MSTIDAHVHLYPPEVNRDPAGWAAAHGEPHWAQLTTRRRKNGSLVQGFPSVDELLRELDTAGIERAVLLGWYWERPENSAAQNRFFAEWVRLHPTRLSACATINPVAGGSATLAEIRWAKDAGFVGLGELSPHAQGYVMDDPVFREALALAGELHLPVNLHVTDPDSRPYPGRVLTPLGDFVALAQALPQTTFVLAHWGGLLPLRAEYAAAVRALGNLYYDTAASPLMYDATIWRRFVDGVGVEKVLFGSDLPLSLYPRIEAGAGLVRFVAELKSELRPEEAETILSGGARIYR